MCGKHREALFHGVFKVGQLHLHLLVCVKGEELEWSKNVVSLWCQQSQPTDRFCVTSRFWHVSAPPESTRWSDNVNKQSRLNGGVRYSNDLSVNGTAKTNR